VGHPPNYFARLPVKERKSKTPPVMQRDRWITRQTLRRKIKPSAPSKTVKERPPGNSKPFQKVGHPPGGDICTTDAVSNPEVVL
jgi:hypothetical protein